MPASATGVHLAGLVKAATGEVKVILVLVASPTLGIAATTAAATGLRHRSCGIHVTAEKEDGGVGNIFYC